MSINKVRNKPHSLLSRRNTARGSSTGLVIVGPTKVKACKSILFTEGIPEIKINYVSDVCVMIIYGKVICIGLFL